MKTSVLSSLQRLALAALAAGGFAAQAPRAHADLAVVDQSNSIGTSTFRVDAASTQQYDIVSQTFVPTLPVINAATFSLRATDTILPGVWLNLYDGAGPVNTLLARAYSGFALTSQEFTTIEFDLTSVVRLVPGRTYTLSLSVSANGAFGTAYSNANPYANGDLLNYSASLHPYDAVFSEGLTSADLLPGAGGVPEPSAWVLFGMGLTGWGAVSLRHRTRGA